MEKRVFLICVQRLYENNSPHSLPLRSTLTHTHKIQKCEGLGSWVCVTAAGNRKQPDCLSSGPLQGAEGTYECTHTANHGLLRVFRTHTRSERLRMKEAALSNDGLRPLTHKHPHTRYRKDFVANNLHDLKGIPV